VLAPFLAAAGCAVAPPRGDATPDVAVFAWQAPLHRDHPLVGRVWNAREHRFDQGAALAHDAADADFVLIGALDDNPDHHVARAHLIAGIAARRRPVLAFDSMDSGMQETADRARALNPHDVAALVAALGAGGRADAVASVDRPELAAAVAADLPIALVDLPPAGEAEFAARGPGALAPAVQRLFMRGLPPEALARQMYAELSAFHCGLVPHEVLHHMLLTQVARDAFIADRLLTVPPEEGVVVITGIAGALAGRRFGTHLSREAPDRKIVRVAVLEVQAGRESPEDYLAMLDPGVAPFHHVIFTPAIERADPCRGHEHRPTLGGPAVLSLR